MHTPKSTNKPLSHLSLLLLITTTLFKPFTAIKGTLDPYASDSSYTHIANFQINGVANSIAGYEKSNEIGFYYAGEYFTSKENSEELIGLFYKGESRQFEFKENFVNYGRIIDGISKIKISNLGNGCILPIIFTSSKEISSFQHNGDGAYKISFPSGSTHTLDSFIQDQTEITVDDKQAFIYAICPFFEKESQTEQSFPFEIELVKADNYDDVRDTIPAKLVELVTSNEITSEIGTEAIEDVDKVMRESGKELEITLGQIYFEFINQISHFILIYNFSLEFLIYLLVCCYASKAESLPYPSYYY